MFLTDFTRRSFFKGLISVFVAFHKQLTKQKTVDKRNATEVNEYAVGFASEGSGGVGHAFVIWYYSDPAGARTVRRAAGFYPLADSTSKAYDMILGITGQVIDDSATKIDTELTVLVNQSVFDKAIAVENKYQVGQTYHLAFNDCTTFVQEVAQTIPGLVVPSRTLNPMPDSFIATLYAGN